MNGTHHVAFAALVAAGTILGWAPTASASLAATEREFAAQNRALQEESISMPAGSPAVDVRARPADALPAAHTLAQEEARFVKEDRWLQRESTGSPAGSPHVSRSEPPADAVPHATTRGREIAGFDAQNQFLQQASTP